MRHSKWLSFAFLPLVGAAALTAQQPKTYRARLSPVPIDVSMQATVAGSGSVSAVLTGTKLAVTGTFEGLKSPATIAQIHKGPTRGVRGPNMLDLAVIKTDAASGTISGSFDAHGDPGRRPREGPAVRAASQREGPRRQPVGLAPAAGEQTMRRSVLWLTALAGTASLGITIVTAEPGRGGQQPPPPVFNASQAATGSSVYAASCASCHMADLAGRNEAPQLAGNNFMQHVAQSRSTKDLFEFIQSTMPPTGENLSAAQYLAVTAYILQANGAPAGEAALTATTAVPIGSIATGATPTRRRRRRAGRRRRGSGGRQGPPGGPGQAPRRRTRRRAGQRRPARRHRHRHGEELRAGDRRDAAQSGSGRLADGAAQLSGLEPQPAHADHARQRRRICSWCGAGA